MIVRDEIEQTLAHANSMSTMDSVQIGARCSKCFVRYSINYRIISIQPTG